MQSIQNQAELERIAEDILIEKQLIIDLDRRRNDNRMALRSLSKDPPKKTYFFAGGLFMKFPTPAVQELLKSDQSNIDGEIQRLRDSVREHARELEKKETGGVTRNKGFDLKGMGRHELGEIAKHPVAE
ncbi:p53 and DNA damage-regulated protein 1 [Thoreauomyces humboldtii]|nr:p53 and DNA damage-regulated protein 1 [Thoreauomyces humboldtii]